MTFAVLFLLTFTSMCCILLALAPWITQSSSEARRMLSVVKSNRADKRRIPALERFTNLLARQTRRIRRPSGSEASEKLLRRFNEAGLRSPHIGEYFALTQAFGVLCGAGLGVCVLSSPLFGFLAGGAGGFLLPDLWLQSKQRRRRERLRRAVPDMVDLLVICVEAGLGLDQALLRVTEELTLSHPDLSEELERVLLERGAGASRIDAWRGFAERTRLEEITAFVSMLVETDRFGSPITGALSHFSDELRTKRRQHAEEAAAKTKIKIIFPLVLCIFPCIFIVLLVPAVLGFFQHFSTMGR